MKWATERMRHRHQHRFVLLIPQATRAEIRIRRQPKSALAAKQVLGKNCWSRFACAFGWPTGRIAVAGWGVIGAKIRRFEHGRQRKLQYVTGLVKGRVEIEGVDRVKLLFELDISLVELLGGLP